MECGDFVLAVGMVLDLVSMVEVAGELSVIRGVMDPRCCISTILDVESRARPVVVGLQQWVFVALLELWVEVCCVSHSDLPIS